MIICDESGAQHRHNQIRWYLSDPQHDHIRLAAHSIPHTSIMPMQTLEFIGAWLGIRHLSVSNEYEWFYTSKHGFGSCFEQAKCGGIRFLNEMNELLHVFVYLHFVTFNISDAHKAVI